VAVNAPENSGVGVWIKYNASGNFIADNCLHLQSAPSTNRLDLEDNNVNPNCDNDTWFNDTFSTANLSCIH
jgi:hypothetical protein